MGASPAAANFSSPAKNRKARLRTESFNFLRGSVRACEVATESLSENTNPNGEDRSERIVQAAGESARIVGIAKGLVRVAKQPFIRKGASVLLSGEGQSNREVARRCGSPLQRSATGAADTRNGGWPDCTTNCVRGARAPTTTSRWRS